MNNYISTYFYHDIEESGATYGNIFLPLNERNCIYWQTVFTLFFSAIIFNKDSKIKFLLFTNVTKFPFRDEIEALGVKIYDGLKLSKRNPAKWATVNFFFDVIDFVSHSDDFSMNDTILMLDTDVVAIGSAFSIFEYARSVKRPLAYIFDDATLTKFHGVSISELECIGSSVFNTSLSIKKLIGGEFFCFTKYQVSDFGEHFTRLIAHNLANKLTTEEQILTLVNAYRSWDFYPTGIFRVWTTLRYFKVPNNRNTYIFLHLPSEKATGLNELFQAVKMLNPHVVDKVFFCNLLQQCVEMNFIKFIFKKLNTIFLKRESTVEK